MSLYLITFAAAAFIDALPAFAPPCWTALLYLQIRYRLDVPLVVAAGVLGSTLGRLILTTYVHRASEVILSRHEEHNIHYLGKTLGRSLRADFAFIFIYCLTPLATSPLFLAAGMTNLSRWCIMPPFFFGKLISYSMILTAGDLAADDLAALFHGKLTWQGALIPVLGAAFVLGMLFIDWRALIHDRKIRLRFDVLRLRRGEGSSGARKGSFGSGRSAPVS